MDTIFGIDLGTTNSSLAVLRDGKPIVIPIDNCGACIKQRSSHKNVENTGSM
ncbi:MAG TPA: hypothetical protein ENK96_09605 [Desulfobulbaceae bacterium]|nr:hypothetical protein [Desulfobulbaceae bacterium]